MRKIMFLMMIMLLSMGLVACVEPSIDRLKFDLNPGIDTIELHSEHVDEGAKATYGFRTLAVEVISINLDTSKIGKYEIIYYITYLDFEKTLTRKVTVVDEMLPVVTLNPGLDTIYQGETWIDQGVSSDEIIEVEVAGFVDINMPGEYVITYTIRDINGQEFILYRYVNVIER